MEKRVTDIVKKSLNKSIVPILQKTWNAIPVGGIIMHTLISMDIHAYAKFTPAEFETFIKPNNETKKKQLLDLHAQFKDLDWFWNQGLYFFRNDIDEKYYIRSYYDYDYYQLIPS